MATEKLRLRIATPEKVKFDSEADMVIMRCITGDMGILPGREACSAILDFGVLRILQDGAEQRMAVLGGIAQVRDDFVTILANDAQWPGDIDIAQAEEDHERSKLLIREGGELLELQKEQVQMRRTLVQIEVSSYPLLQGTPGGKAADSDGG